MNAVLYYSNTGESKRIAEYISAQTGYGIYDITQTEQFTYENAVIVFPVYCQNVPKTVCKFLSQLSARHLALIATYGKMGYGNVLNEIQRKFNHDIIAGAYIPAKHAYLNEPRFDAFNLLAPVISKLNAPATVAIPRSRKNPFANFMPKFRSQTGCKIVKDATLCNNCGKCTETCPEQAINCGVPNKKCIRCMHCVETCPNKALQILLKQPMKKYLSKQKINKTVIYV